MKTVSIPVRVPSGNYCWCWETFGKREEELCEHFDNEHGRNRCDLGFDIVQCASVGVMKPAECAALKEVKDQP